jgi:WD40 repeat protein
VHPNIVQIHEVGETQGCPYLTLEYVAGGSLASKLDDALLPARQAAELVETLARAMEAAHQQRILHRDLKPANVLLTSDGQPKITDFGLAKQLDDDSAQTQSGAILGTPSYMAPEQARGEMGSLGPACDIHALGAILYQMLTGRPPFLGLSMMDTLDQVCRQEPVTPRLLNAQVPRDLETICLKCLDKEPAKRYGSAGALADDLRRFLDGQPILARPAGAVERAYKWARRRPALATLIAVLVLAGAAFWIVGVIYNLEMREASRQILDAKATADEETQSAIRANAAAKTALHQAKMNLYFNNLLLAQGHLAASNLDRAEELLDACPREFRCWEWRHLKHCCHTERLAFQANPDGVAAVALSPDGTRLACGGGKIVRANQPTTVTLHDAGTGKLLLTFDGRHTGPVSALAYSPDGKLIASASTGWDYQALAQGNLAALEKPRGEVIVWDTATGAELYRRPGCSTLAFSPDGKLLAAAGHNSAVMLWETETGKEVASLPGHVGKVRSLGFSPDGKLLAAASAAFALDGKGRVAIQRDFKLWDVTNHKEADIKLRGNPGPVAAVAFQPIAGRDLELATAAGNTIRLWNLTTGEEKRTLAGAAPFEEVLFSADGTLLASADQTLADVKVWELATGRLLHMLPAPTGALTCLAFAPTAKQDAQLIVRGTSSGQVALWDLVSSPNPARLPGHDTMVTSVAFSKDRLASSSPDESKVLIWGAEGKLLRRLGCFALQLALHPNGKLLACAGGDLRKTHLPGSIRLWDLDTGAELPLLLGPPPTRFVKSVAISPNGKLLACASGDFRQPRPADQAGEVRVWELPTGKLLVTQKLPAGYVTMLAFSPDSRRLALAGSDRAVQVCDAQTLKPLNKYQGHAREVLSVAFHPDGIRMAAGDASGMVLLWDTNSNQELLRISADTRAITALAFHPREERLAAASFGLTGSGNVKLWDSKSGRQVLVLDGQLCAVFHPDGHTLAAADAAGVKLWKAQGERASAP